MRCLLLYVFLATGLSSEEPEKAEKPPAKVLTLEEFVRKTCARHPRFQELLAEKAALKFERVTKSQDSDIVAEVNGEYGFNMSPATENTTEVAVGLSKLFLNTGTEVSATYAFTPVTDSAGNVTRAYGFEAALVQPVLNNAFGYQNRVDERIADAEIAIARHHVVEAYEEFLATLVKTYFQWVANYARLDTARATHEENLKVLRDMQRRRARNIALPVDVNKVRLKALNSEADVVRLQNEYDEAIQLVRDALVEKTLEGWQPQLPEAYTQLPVNFEKAFSEVSKQSRTFSMLALLKKKAVLDDDKYANDLLPTANITARYSLDSTDPAFANNNDHDVFIGFALSYPLGNTTARARRRRAAIFVKKRRFEARSKATQLRVELQNLYTRIKTLVSLLELAQRQLGTAQGILRAERRYFQRGRISLNDLIRATSDVERLKFRLNDLKVERDSLFVEWLRLTDQLVTKMPLKDSLPPQD